MDVRRPFVPRTSSSAMQLWLRPANVRVAPLHLEDTVHRHARAHTVHRHDRQCALRAFGAIITFCCGPVTHRLRERFFGCVCVFIPQAYAFRCIAQPKISALIFLRPTLHSNSHEWHRSKRDRLTDLLHVAGTGLRTHVDARRESGVSGCGCLLF